MFYNHHPYNQNIELYENILFFFNNSYVFNQYELYYYKADKTIIS